MTCTSSGRIFVTGDTHGVNIERFSYKNMLDKGETLRGTTVSDVMVVCGDTGIGWRGADREFKYQLDYLESKHMTFLLVRGNHDNYDCWWRDSVPTRGNGAVKLVSGTLCNPKYGDKIYQNVFLVPDAAILRVCGFRVLVISGAESHDAQNLVYPHEKGRIKGFRKSYRHYRVVGKSWWPQEPVNDKYAASMLADLMKDGAWYGSGTFKFDFIFTHDCPASMLESGEFIAYSGMPRMYATQSETFLEKVRNDSEFTYWFHGHMHVEPIFTYNSGGMYGNVYSRRGGAACICLYHEVYQITEEYGRKVPIHNFNRLRSTWERLYI